MKKKFIAVLCAISSVMSLTVAVHAKDTVILDDDFSSGNTGYVTTVPDISGTVEEGNGVLLHKHSASNGADSRAGIKKDITQALKENSLKKGDTLSGSVDVSSSWYGGAAKACVKIDDMTIDLGTVESPAQQGSDWPWTTQKLDYYVNVNIEIPDNYTAYFVVTQQCGYVFYDNIKLTLHQDDGDTPVDPVDPTEKPVVSTQLIDNSIFKEGKFEVYDTTSNDTNGSIETVWDNGLQVKFNTGWNGNHGVKADITEYIKGYSGRKFTLSVQTINWAWEGDNGTVNKAKAFFKVVGNGGETTVPIVEGPDEAIENGSAATLTGSTELAFSDTDTVYLCFTQGGGQHQYKELSLSVSGEAVSPTEQPSEEPTNPPTGEWKEVLDTTGMDQTKLETLLSDGSITQYGEKSTGIEVNPNEYNQKPCIKATSNYESLSGMKINISQYVQQGSTVKAEFQLKSTDSKKTEVSLLEHGIQSEHRYSLESSPNWSWDIVTTDEFMVTANNNDEVYLIIGNQAGSFYVADLVIYVKSGADAPAPIPVFSYEPAEFDGTLDGATLTADNMVLEKGSEKVSAYKCSYTGPATHGLDVIVTSGDANANATITTNIADNSPVVFYVVTNRASVDTITATSID